MDFSNVFNIFFILSFSSIAMAVNVKSWKEEMLKKIDKESRIFTVEGGEFVQLNKE